MRAAGKSSSWDSQPYKDTWVTAAQAASNTNKWQSYEAQPRQRDWNYVAACEHWAKATSMLPDAHQPRNPIFSFSISAHVQGQQNGCNFKIQVL